MFHRGRHVRPRSRHRGGVLGGIALALAVAGGLWWTGGAAEPGDEPGAPTAPADQAGDQAGDQADGERRAVDAAIDVCRSVYAQQSAPLQEARRSLAQWQAHVAVMNQLVAAEFTATDAAAVWERTRQGVAQQVADFTVAHQVYLDSDDRCSGVDETPAGPSSRVLTRCVGSTAARDEALIAAKIAVETWRHHIDEMDEFRVGNITAEQATQSWQDTWRQGENQLDAYERELRQARRSTC